MWRICISFLLVFTAIPLNGQIYFFDNYNVADGLSQSTVYHIIQDRSHNLWIGTQSGVSVFDGNSFQNYTAEDGLAGNGVRTICQDHSGQIWLGHTGGGITRYKEQIFQQIKLPGLNLSSDITAITEDKKNTIWIMTAGAGAIRIMNPGSKPQNIQIAQFKGDELSDQVFGSALGRDGTLYLITDIGIKKFDQTLNRFVTFQPEGLTTYFNKTCMLEDSHGDLWFGTYHGGLYRYLQKEKRFVVYDIRDGLSYNWISTLNEDTRGNVWAGTWGGGLTRFSGDSITIFNSRNGLQDDKIWCMANDVEGNLLIGTNDHGLSIFKGEAFINFGIESGPQVWAIEKDFYGNYWFGTNGGLTRLTPRHKGSFETTTFSEKTHPIYNQIRFIRQDNHHNLWIGTNGGGIFQYLPLKNRFVFDPVLNNLLYKDLVVTALVIDGKNQLWAGTNDGLVYFEIDTRKGDRLSQTNGLAGNNISSLNLDHNNNLWIGAKSKGLTRYNDQTEKFTRIVPLSNITPRCMVQDEKGDLWVGSEGQGVYVLRNDSLIMHLSEKDGLLANLINLITTDKYGNILIGTNKGLNKYIPQEKRMITYTRRNGFTGIETKENATTSDPAGYIWFGTVNGAIRYKPEEERMPSIQPLTHIRRLRVNYSDYPMTEGMHLPWYDNAIIFDYYSVCLSNPDVVSYQVMLKGADKNWQPVTRQTMINYSALPPNQYTFLVRAKNACGQWNDPPVSFSFQILPPFWRTWWFILLCIVFGGSVIFVYIKIREQNLINEKRVLEEKVQERTLEVTRKNEELAHKNKDITDSIRYAERLQRAMLPPEIPFGETFVLYRPKAIVSGDFYWLTDNGTHQFMAAIDCTGHGVPGAFMSIIAYNSLNKIVREYKITEPASILEHLNLEVNMALQQKSDQATINDGMDLGLIVYDPQNHELSYAGAMIPLIFIRQGELQEVKGDKFSIGRLTRNDQKFTNHVIPIQSGDIIYLYSDGYSDQFGGPYGKKFKSGPLKERLLSIHELPVQEQRNSLIRSLEEWMKAFEQNDDILIIGRRF